MAEEPANGSGESPGGGAEAPAPETLRAKRDVMADEEANGTPTDGTDGAANQPAALAKRPRRGTYRPSHKATFIGLAAVVAILAINAAVILFVIRRQTSEQTQVAKGQVTINQDALDKLGVNRSAVGDAGVKLTINPDTAFGGMVEVAEDVSIGGQLKLNGRFSASDATFTNLTAGNTGLQQLNVNGASTVTTLNVRNEMVVAGITRLQGDVTLSRLLTVNNSANVAGNLAVGGALTVNTFQSRNLTIENNLTIGGKLITRGSAPGVAAGNALGSNGTVSISGNDTVGTVAANVGVGASSGIVARVTFRNSYSSTPRVVVTAVGAGVGSVYVTRSSTGFNIGVNGAMPPGGYAFDYIVAQ